MASAKQRDWFEEERQAIAARVRELRQSRKWTQAELSKQLHLSQSRLSEIERGDGSFTAEQFLLLLKLFNVTASHFVNGAGERDLRIQNALVRLGAFHVQESAHVLPSEELADVHAVVREALAGGAPRTLTALAPVFVRNTERLNLPRLHAELERVGLERRLAWVVENTLMAIRSLHKLDARSKEWAKLDRRAELQLDHFLGYITATDHLPSRDSPLDILDTTIRSKRTLDEVRGAGSEISRRWGIVTSLQPEDFLQALKAARAHH